MKVHISLNVSDLERSVNFYKRMLSSEPVKLIKEEGGVSSQRKPGYAKFDIANPPLNLTLNEHNVTRGNGLSHLGLQVDSTEGVLEFKQRWEDSGLITEEEMDVICCYARQDKAWVRDPDGNEWEAFTVLENVDPAVATTGSCCAGDAISGEKAKMSSPVEGSEVKTSTEDLSSVLSSSCC